MSAHNIIVTYIHMSVRAIVTKFSNNTWISQPDLVISQLSSTFEKWKGGGGGRIREMETFFLPTTISKEIIIIIMPSHISQFANK